MVVLEAMAAGVPVVAFAVGGIPDVLDETAGWLVKPGDTAALGAAMGDALRRPEEGKRRAGRARKILDERFGLEQWVESVQAVYRRVSLF
jgi:glycosyltransferase involved in cell wall biosynthesis